MKNKNKKVKIKWVDAVIYNPYGSQKNISKMETTGILLKDSNGFLWIKNPKTINIKTKEPHPKENDPTFFMIPKGVVTKIEEI